MFARFIWRVALSLLCTRVYHVDMSEITMPTASIRRELAEVLRMIHAGETIRITHYEREAAVMVPPDWYEKAVRALFNAEVNGEDGSE